MKPYHWLLLAGYALTISGLFHALAYVCVGAGNWEGPLSIRKPILFGFSTGLTLFSLGWIQSKLPSRKRDVIVSPLLALALLIEVGLITLQCWRGVASHFNHDTQLNAAITQWMTILIVVASIAIADLAWRCSFGFRESANTSNEMKLAIQAGMAFLMLSLGLGFVIHFYGEHLAGQGLPPTTFGKAGVMKFPHGVAIHAVQFFPMLVWLLRKLSNDSEQRTRLLKYAIASMALFLVFSLTQTFTGRARFDVGLLGGTLLVATAISSVLLLLGVGNVSRRRLFRG